MHVVNALDHFAQKNLETLILQRCQASMVEKEEKVETNNEAQNSWGIHPPYDCVLCMFTLLPPGSASKTFNNCSMRGFNHFHVCGSFVFNDNTRGIFVWEHAGGQQTLFRKLPVVDVSFVWWVILNCPRARAMMQTERRRRKVGRR